MGGMSELIEALEIFKKYEDPDYPTNCEHDELWICIETTPEDMTEKDVARLEELGFDYYEDGWKSFKFGSA